MSHSVPAAQLPATRHTGCDASLVVALVHASRAVALCDALHRVWPDCRIEMASSVGNASLRLVLGTVRLLVLDLQFEPGQPPALVHVLARCAPATTVLAFDELAAAVPGPAQSVWAWDQMLTVFEQALDVRRASQFLNESQP
jgi:hypothetical protein